MKCIDCKNNKKCKFVTKKTSREIRKEIWDILRETNKDLKENQYPGFTPRIVGSSKRNMVFQHGEELFDTDIQIEFTGKKAQNLHVNFKKTFRETIDKFIPDNWSSKLSTSVITLNKIEDNVLIHYFDLAIIRKNGIGFDEILRGKNSDKKSGDYFKWNELGNVNSVYTQWKEITGDERISVKERDLDKKCKTREIDKDNDDHESSSALFLKAFNEVIKKNK